MTIRVLGFEGSSPSDTKPCSWGAAAVTDGRKVWNAVTGRTVTRDELAEYVEKGSVCPIEFEILPPEGHTITVVPNTVMRIPTVSHLDTKEGDMQVVLDLFRVQSLGWTEKDGQFYAAFESMEAFTDVCDFALCALVDRATELSLEDGNRWLKIGFVMDSNHPELLATWLFGRMIRLETAMIHIERRAAGQLGSRPRPSAPQRFEQFRETLMDPDEMESWRMNTRWVASQLLAGRGKS